MNDLPNILVNVAYVLTGIGSLVMIGVVVCIKEMIFRKR